jgi:hypothetical protein
MYRISSRSSQCYIGDSVAKEVHCVKGERSQCRVEDLLLLGRAVGFTPDTLAQARSEGFNPCTHCNIRQSALAR